MPAHSWVYPARLMRVVDGDTLRVLIDRGHRGYQALELRLLGVDTPETVGVEKPLGIAARDFVRAWLADRGVLEDPTPTVGGPWPLRIRTEKDPDNFGRWLGDVWTVATGECLQDAIEAAGHDETEGREGI